MSPETKAKYNVGDIVYFIAHPSSPTGEGHPAIGSLYEIDCKVLDGFFSHNYLCWVYNLMTGSGNNLQQIQEVFLVPAKDRINYVKNGKKLIEDTELCPKDTIFILDGDYWINEAFGVYIQVDRFKSLKHLFA